MSRIIFSAAEDANRAAAQGNNREGVLSSSK